MKEILEYLKKVASATIEDIYLNTSRYYYHNSNKHISQIMSRLVKQGKVIRIAPGTFRIAPVVKKEIINQEELEL